MQVRALTDAEQESKGGALPPRTQAIFGFDMAAWAEWKRRVRPSDALMRHRAPVQLPGNARLLPARRTRTRRPVRVPMQCP